MSYILEALKKEQAGQGHLPSLQSTPVPVAIETRTHSIAWGILLTLAIFAALLAGYWLGQNNHQGLYQQPLTRQNNTGVQASQQAPQQVVQQAVQQTLQQGAEITIQESLRSEKVAQNKVPPSSEKIAAEAYFEHPPVTVQEQLIVSANAQPKKNVNLDFKVQASDGVSEDLLARFQSAIDETEDNSLAAQSDASRIDESGLAFDNSGVTPLHAMPDWVQQGVPELLFELHIFCQ